MICRWKNCVGRPRNWNSREIGKPKVETPPRALKYSQKASLWMPKPVAGKKRCGGRLGKAGATGVGPGGGTGVGGGPGGGTGGPGGGGGGSGRGGGGGGNGGGGGGGGIG